MPTTYKILGQVNPSANTTSSLYAVPAATSAVCSTLSIANIGTAANYNVSVRPGSQTLADKHYVVYNASINAYDSIFLSLGLTLSANDRVEVRSSTANVSFGIFGSEIS